MSKVTVNVWCFASVMPIRKILSAQLSKPMLTAVYFLHKF